MLMGCYFFRLTELQLYAQICLELTCYVIFVGVQNSRCGYVIPLRV